jgi:hypothetical protein
MSSDMSDNFCDSELLKNDLQQILANENLAMQKTLIATISTDLQIDVLNCASALLYLLQYGKSTASVTEQKQDNAVAAKPLTIKMVRYRLAVGSKHQLAIDDLKQVLVEESGVDKNNISHINIQDLYTLVDLPDEMPLDIFQHLKTVEINQQKLDIRRVKTRNKKRGNNHRRGRQMSKNSAQAISH